MLSHRQRQTLEMVLQLIRFMHKAKAALPPLGCQKWSPRMRWPRLWFLWLPRSCCKHVLSMAA